MGKVVEDVKDSRLCAVEGCSRLGVLGQGSKLYCQYHNELFDRGTAYVKATPVVSNMAAYAPLIRLERLLSRVSRAVLADEETEGIEEVIRLGTRLKMEPEKLRRREIVNGIGELVPEPGRVYACRVSDYLSRFIVDRACEKVGLPAVGKTVKIEKESTNGQD